MRRLKDDLAQSTAVFLQRKFLKHSEALLLRPCKSKIIFDFDDAVFCQPSINE